MQFICLDFIGLGGNTLQKLFLNLSCYFSHTHTHTHFFVSELKVWCNFVNICQNVITSSRSSLDRLQWDIPVIHPSLKEEDYSLHAGCVQYFVAGINLLTLILLLGHLRTLCLWCGLRTVRSFPCPKTVLSSSQQVMQLQTTPVNKYISIYISIYNISIL